MYKELYKEFYNEISVQGVSTQWHLLKL